MSVTTTERVLLLDSAGLYFRAFHGVPTGTPNPDGTTNNAIRGFLDMVTTLVERYAPTALIACWDNDWRPQFRVDLVPTYKAHRLDAVGEEDSPPELTSQVPVISAVLDAIGIARVGVNGFEADDVIGTLTGTYASAGAAVAVVTGDRDLFQLVDDAAGVKVVYVARGGVREPDIVDEAWLAQKYGLRSGAAYADLATLRGDPSDGLPGVTGIGEKTAATLLRLFHDLPGVIHAATHGSAGMTPAQRTKVLAGLDYLAVAPQVVQVRRDVPIPEHDAALPTGVNDPVALADLLSSHRIGDQVRRLLTALHLIED